MSLQLIHPRMAPEHKPYQFMIYERDFYHSLQQVLPYFAEKDMNNLYFTEIMQELPRLFPTLTPLAAGVFASRYASSLTGITDAVDILYWFCTRSINPEDALAKFTLDTPPNITERVKITVDSRGDTQIATVDPISIINAPPCPFQSPRGRLQNALAAIHTSYDQAQEFLLHFWALPVHHWTDLLYRLKTYVPDEVYGHYDAPIDMIRQLNLHEEGMAFAELAFKDETIQKLTERHRHGICARCYANNYADRCIDIGKIACRECSNTLQTCSFAKATQAHVISAGLGITLVAAETILKMNGAVRTIASEHRATEIEQLLRFHDPINGKATDLRLASRFTQIISRQLDAHHIPSPADQMNALLRDAYAADDMASSVMAMD